VGLILLVILILLLCGSFPVYPYSRTWGPYPASGIGLLLFVLILLLIFRVL
jgi:low affinity Fe/Cu permease